MAPAWSHSNAARVATSSDEPRKAHCHHSAHSRSISAAFLLHSLQRPPLYSIRPAAPRLLTRHGLKLTCLKSVSLSPASARSRPRARGHGVAQRLHHEHEALRVLCNAQKALPRRLCVPRDRLVALRLVQALCRCVAGLDVQRDGVDCGVVLCECLASLDQPARYALPARAGCPRKDDVICQTNQQGHRDTGISLYACQTEVLEKAQVQTTAKFVSVFAASPCTSSPSNILKTEMILCIMSATCGQGTMVTYRLHDAALPARAACIRLTVLVEGVLHLREPGATAMLLI